MISARFWIHFLAVLGVLRPPFLVHPVFVDFSFVVRAVAGTRLAALKIVLEKV